MLLFKQLRAPCPPPSPLEGEKSDIYSVFRCDWVPFRYLRISHCNWVRIKTHQYTLIQISTHDGTQSQYTQPVHSASTQSQYPEPVHRASTQSQYTEPVHSVILYHTVEQTRISKNLNNLGECYFLFTIARKNEPGRTICRSSV